MKSGLDELGAALDEVSFGTRSFFVFLFLLFFLSSLPPCRVLTSLADIIGFLLPGVTWGPREGGWLVKERSSSLGGKREKKKKLETA